MAGSTKKHALLRVSIESYAPANRLSRHGSPTPSKPLSFAGSLTTPALQWPKMGTPVIADEHRRRRQAIGKLVKRRLDGVNSF